MAEILKEQFTEFQLVQGAPGWSQGWRGISLDADPASLQPNQLRRALNVVFDQGNLKGRQGSTLAASLSGVPYYMGNFQMNPHNRLWLAERGCFGVGAGTGASVLVYDPEISSSLLTVSRYTGSIDNTPFFGSLGDKLFLGYNSLLREIPIVEVKIGDNPYALGASQANLPLRDFSGYTIVGMLEYPEISTLFIGLMDNATPTNGLIVSYNGLSFVTEYTGLRPYSFGRWRNQIIAGFAGGIRWRDNTSATWTAVASGGFTCWPSQNAIAEYRDKTYIAGGAGNLYSYDGSAIATARTIATAHATEGIVGVAVHDGLLYYLWNVTITAGMKLGKFDLDSTALPYIDTYKDLVAQNAHFTHGSGLLSWASVLYATRTQESLAASPANDVKGTWVFINDGGVGSNFAVVSAFPF